MAQKPTIPQGTRDFSPLQVQRRKFILNAIEQVFKKYGFMPLETPAIEYISTLTGKYGDEGDQLVFKILNSGDYLKNLIEYNDKGLGHENLDKTFLPSLDGKLTNLDSKRTLPFIAEKGLRYDLTVPFARYVAMNRNEITFPFKRYQMQPVWRADRPQKGRYREFWQCDADVIGSTSLINEAELLKVYDECFSFLSIPVNIKINNRKILSALAEIIQAKEKFTGITMAIDKLDKIGESGVRKELEKMGLDADQVNTVLRFLILSELSQPMPDLENLFKDSEEGMQGLKELKTVFSHLEILQTHNSVKLDVGLARGLTYYTGTIVEVQAKVGDYTASIGGGGRYDNLTGNFGLPDVSGVGISFGLDRIYDVMEGLELFPKEIISNDTKVLLCYFDEASQIYALKICTQLRAANIPAQIYPDIVKKIGKQLEYANKLNISFACIIGSKEMESGKPILKDLTLGTQEELTLEELLHKF